MASCRQMSEINAIQCQNLNSWAAICMNKVEMMPSGIGKRLMEGKLKVLVGPWVMLGVCSLSVLGSCIHCSCLFLCIIVRQ